MEANTSTAGQSVATATQISPNVNANAKIYQSHASPAVTMSRLDATPRSSRIPDSFSSPSSALSTPKKLCLDSPVLRSIRNKLSTPGGAFELKSIQLDNGLEAPVNLLKGRYLICSKPKQFSASSFAKAPSSYRHLVNMNISNIKCTDIYTGEEMQCKIINDSLQKVQQAYFRLQQDEEECRSSIYGHSLIRDVKDFVFLSKQRTYVILRQPHSAPGSHAAVFEDLHTYLREKHRLCETEARTLFHQICETVLFCHRNGIILRDLKLKRFFFVDEARTMLQYESLEGSMILDNPDDDTLSEKIGCPLYTAPELLCPEPTFQGKPADMWALGVILYTMLVGQYPFLEKGNNNLITIIRQCVVPLPVDLTAPARWLLLSLLRKNKDDRVPIDYIFLAPWLREQRPFYMYVPVDAEIPEDSSEEEEASSSCTIACMDITEDDGVQPLDYSCTTLNCDDDYAEMR